jgi:hypothetical protein
VIEVSRVPPSRYPRLLRAACVLALVGLALMVWSILDPRPMPVILAMSVGQAIGTASLLLFLVVVVADLRRLEVKGETDEKDAAKG